MRSSTNHGLAEHHRRIDFDTITCHFLASLHAGFYQSLRSRSSEILPGSDGDDRIAKSFAFWQNLVDVAPEFFLRFKGGIPGLITKLGFSGARMIECCGCRGPSLTWRIAKRS